CFATSDGSSTQIALAVGIVRNEALVSNKLIPGDIALVMVAEQHVPGFPISLGISLHLLPTVLNRRPDTPSSERVRTGIHRVGEDVIQGRVAWCTPFDFRIARTSNGEG